MQRGFTLIEVLAVVAIVPLVLASSFGAVAVALRTYRTITARSEMSADGMRALELIGQDMRSVTEVYQDSSADRFHARLAAVAGEGEDEGEGPEEVEYEWSPGHGDDPGTLSRNGADLFGPDTDVSSCDFEYLGLAPDPDAPAPVVSPVEARAVRVRLELSRGETSMGFESLFNLRNV